MPMRAATAEHEEQLLEVEPLNLQVILAPEAGMWIAQAIEIDYAAAGESLDDAKERFEDGLAGTISENLKRFGNLDSLLGPAPPKPWHELWKQNGKRLSSLSKTTLDDFAARSQLGDVTQFFPFDKIAYFTPAVP